MHCNELHQHLADMHIIENNLCACGQPETSEHFLFHTWQLYQDARHDMQRSLTYIPCIQADLNLQTILQGHPAENLNIVQFGNTFLTRSKRFFLLSQSKLLRLSICSVLRSIHMQHE